MTNPTTPTQTLDPNDFDLTLIIGRHIEGDHKDTHLLPIGQWTYGDMVDVLVDALVWALDEMPTKQDQAEFTDDILRRIRTGSENIMGKD